MYSKSTPPRGIQQMLTLSLAILFCAAPLTAQETKDEGGDVTEMPPDTGATAMPAPPPAAEPSPPPAPAPEAEVSLAVEEIAAPAEEEKPTAGVNVDVGIATMYNFRGLNTFQESSQQDQNALFAPSVTWSIFDTGLYLGYWGAYQLTGNNKTAMVESALGHEQDLYLGYDLGLANDVVTLNFLFTYYFYPFADEDVAGTANPSIIEPLVGISIATVLDLGFSVSYFHGIQEETKALRHVYFHLTAGKGFEFNDTFGMNLGAGFGAKAWIEESDSNRFDLLFDWSVPIHLTEQLYVEPGVHLGWTDLDTILEVAPDGTESTRDAHGGDEFMVYGSINVGADF
jgi:hypothetical protein